MQPMQPMQPMAAYQPQPKFLDKYGSYSFGTWIMIAIVIIVIGAMFAQVTDLVGAPNPADYDDASKYAEDQFSHEKLGTSLGALSTMLQSVGMGLIAYALLRESNQGDAHHTAVRVTAVITGVLLVGNLAGANLSIF
jgi:heme/copper-type cytochrome/quinol oxidase subunit 2